MTVRELKARLKSIGLPTARNKNALATRLTSHTLKDGKDAVSTTQLPPLDVERKIDESTAHQMKEMELKVLRLELEQMKAEQGRTTTTGNPPTTELTSWTSGSISLTQHPGQTGRGRSDGGDRSEDLVLLARSYFSTVIS